MVKVTFYNAQDGIKKTFNSEATTVAELREDFELQNLSFKAKKQKMIVTTLDKTVVNQTLELNSSTIPETDFIAMIFNRESKAGGRSEVLSAVKEALNSVEGEERNRLFKRFVGEKSHYTNVSSALLEQTLAEIGDDSTVVEEEPIITEVFTVATSVVEAPDEVDNLIEEMEREICKKSRKIRIDC